jgi:hypothetical protein
MTANGPGSGSRGPIPGPQEAVPGEDAASRRCPCRPFTLDGKKKARGCASTAQQIIYELAFTSATASTR